MNQEQIVQMEAKITEKAAESVLLILEKYGLTYQNLPKEIMKVLPEIYQQGMIDTLEEIRSKP